jgi:hypothetical protein
MDATIWRITWRLALCAAVSWAEAAWFASWAERTIAFPARRLRERNC